MFNALKNRYTLWGLTVLIIIYILVATISNVKDSPVFPSNSPEDKKIGEQVERIRLCTFVPSGKLEKQLGVVVQRHNEIRILPLQHAYSMMHDSEAARFTSMKAFILQMEANLSTVKEIIASYQSNPSAYVTYKENDVLFLPPIPKPVRVVDCGVPSGHSRNMKRAFMKSLVPVPIYRSIIVPLNWMKQDGVFSGRPENPVCFVGNNIGIHGSGNNVTLPEGIGEIDMEAELGVIIAKDGYDIPIEQAAKHIAGYVLRNDFSQRDLQADELRNKYGFYKSKALNAMGPYLVTGIDISTFSIRTFVNGEEISVCNTQDFQWTIAEIVSYVSSLGEGISSGQFISLGTLTGGSLFELEQPQLQKGDVVKLVGNQAFGTLENAIVN